MGIVNELLTIKTFRENKAETLLRKQRLQLQEASVRCEAAQRRLEAYREEAHRKERALFDELCNKLVVLRSIEDVQHAVRQMRAQESEHARSLEAAEKDRADQERQVDERKKFHREAARATQKFVDLTKVFAEDAAREEERHEDAEMEEAASNTAERRGWHGIKLEEAP